MRAATTNVFGEHYKELMNLHEKVLMAQKGEIALS